MQDKIRFHQAHGLEAALNIGDGCGVLGEHGKERGGSKTLYKLMLHRFRQPAILYVQYQLW
jgi:hypothetical protein